VRARCLDGFDVFVLLRGVFLCLEAKILAFAAIVLVHDEVNWLREGIEPL